MSELSPAQRTAGTARFLVAAGTLFAAEGIWGGSVARALMAAAIIVFGGGLLFVAKRAD
ncbi:MAG TPA: hypothetical protein PK359_02420 [Burkholderiaceae bacterium]|jgi:hypothetical protein|nr:hypothetical protein [Burkholderiaceae bacterium]